MSVPRKDSARPSSSNPPAHRRTSRLNFRDRSNPAFETVDELDDLDNDKLRKPSAVSHGNRKVSSRQNGIQTTSLTVDAGSVNPAFELVDDLDDLDRKYRKASLARPPSIVASTVAEKEEAEKKQKEYYFKKRFPKSSRVLLFLAVLFFLSTEVMVSVYLWEIYKEPAPQVCHTASCLAAGIVFEAAETVKQVPEIKRFERFALQSGITWVSMGRLVYGSLNQHVNPCDNFYAYACGNFQQKDPFGNRYQDLEELVSDEAVVRLHGILLDLQQNPQHVKSDYQKKCADFHQLCMQHNHTKVRDSVIDSLRRLHWPPLFPANSTAPLRPDLLLREIHQHGHDPLFRVRRMPDSVRANEPFWVIDEGTLLLPRAFYHSTKIQEYVVFIKAIVGNVVLKESGADGDVAKFDFQDGDAKKILDTETRLSQVSHEPSYYKLSVKQFNAAYPNIAKYYNFEDYFDELQVPLNITNSTKLPFGDITEDTKLIMKNRDYFQKLDQVLNDSTARDQAMYLGWRIFYRYLDLIENEPDLWPHIQRFWKAVGIQSEVTWKKCARWAIKALPDGGLTVYKDRYFTKDHNAKVEAMLDRLTTTAQELVEKQTWMDDAARDAAVQKFGRVKRQMPYSPDLFLKNLTTQIYSQVQVEPGDFYRTLHIFQRARQSFFYNSFFNTTVKFIDMFKFAFGMDYRLEDQKTGIIGVFPRMLVSPFYDMTFPGYAQYGLLGFQYARELAHVVDHEWFLLNATGAETNRPNNRTLEKYWERLGSLLELYRNITAELNVTNDEETLYEDSADHAALRLTYRAYQKTIKDSHDGVLPGFPYEEPFTFNQMFYLAFAQQFCENRASLRVKDSTSIGFSEPRIRLAAMLAYSDEFASAFGCSKPAGGLQLFDIPNPPRKLRYQKDITAKRIDEWYHWFDRKPGLPTWSKAW